MGLQDVKEYAKEELKSDEVLLGSVLKFETFYKKYKFVIFSIIALIAMGILGYFGYSYYIDYKNAKANEALLVLTKDANNTTALETLKNNNKPLYELYSLNQATQKNDTKALQVLSNSTDTMIASLSKYTLAVINNKTDNSQYYSDFSTLLDVYQAIDKKDFAKANMLLNSISQDSPLANVVTLYRHYTLAGVSR